MTEDVLLKMLKYFEVKLNIFEFSHVKEIVESWLVYVNKFSWMIQSCFLADPIIFLDRDNKAKLVPAFFFHFLELLQEKIKFQLKNVSLL